MASMLGSSTTHRDVIVCRLGEDKHQICRIQAGHLQKWPTLNLSLLNLSMSNIIITKRHSETQRFKLSKIKNTTLKLFFNKKLKLFLGLLWIKDRDKEYNLYFSWEQNDLM